METDIEKEKKCRYGFLDSIRGLVLVSMILFHTCWDLVYLFGTKWEWYRSSGAYIWQQSICWVFILLSGFCWSMGKNHLKRGLTVFFAGGLVSLVTIIFMPENRVVFGVLTLIGCCMLVMIPLHVIFQKLSPGWGFAISAILFLLTRNVNKGYLGFESLNICKLPDFLYRGNLMTFLGFTKAGFYSTDYFSMVPWVFLFFTGYFCYRFLVEEKDEKVMDRYFIKRWKPLSFLGRHSLIIYILHQPLIYGMLLFFYGR